MAGTTGLGTLGVLVLVLVGLPAPPSDGANILGLFSTFSPSHLVVHMAMMRTLADRGHNVTVMTALPYKLAPHENMTQILAELSEDRMALIRNFMQESTKEKVNMAMAFYRLLTNANTLLVSQYEFLQHPNVRALYERPEQVNYDLVIVGYVFNDFHMGVAAKLGIPVILSWVGVPFTFVDDEVGNTYDPSYVNNINMSQGKLMGFGERLKNFFVWLFMRAMTFSLDRRMAHYYNLAFGEDPSMPSYQELRRRISLLFYNYHSQSEGPVRPTVPQSIEIGGVQIKEHPDPLPPDLADFLGNATAGAIFFSLGTNVKSSYFQPGFMKTLFRVFARQPLRVIWKWDDLENTPGNSTNIYYHNWLPQDDILAHPNTKLFITHAGKGGIAEAQYHGVPMLAVPIFGDQHGNAQTMSDLGFGLTLDWHTMTEQTFEQSINEILHNATYSQKVLKFSALYRDRPLTARQSVVYWTEYVLRHNGAYHLQIPALRLDFVARNNLDVYAFLLFLSAVSLALGLRLLRTARNRCRQSVKVKQQ